MRSHVLPKGGVRTDSAPGVHPESCPIYSYGSLFEAPRYRRDALGEQGGSVPERTLQLRRAGEERAVAVPSGMSPESCVWCDGLGPHWELCATSGSKYRCL
jgi:hypothetical protein